MGQLYELYFISGRRDDWRGVIDDTPRWGFSRKERTNSHYWRIKRTGVTGGHECEQKKTAQWSADILSHTDSTCPSGSSMVSMKTYVFGCYPQDKIYQPDLKHFELKMQIMVHTCKTAGFSPGPTPDWRRSLDKHPEKETRDILIDNNGWFYLLLDWSNNDLIRWLTRLFLSLIDWLIVCLLISNRSLNCPIDSLIGYTCRELD